MYFCTRKHIVMEQIHNIINQQGGFSTVGELKSDSQYRRVLRAVERGELFKVRHGVYASADALSGTMIDVERIIPRGVLCLYSAFMHYGLSTQIQGAWCVAIDAKRKVVVPEFPPFDLYYWKKEYLELGVLQKEIEGYTVRITGLERTICDAVKYRNKIGLDVCGEVLNDYLKREDKNIALLHDYAKQLRVDKILTSFLATRL